MQQQRIDGMRVAILLTDLFEQVEMTDPRKALAGRIGPGYDWQTSALGRSPRS